MLLDDLESAAEAAVKGWASSTIMITAVRIRVRKDCLGVRLVFIIADKDRVKSLVVCQ